MTEAEPDGQEFLAAEYVLGTLDAEERARARDLLAMDPAFAATVRAWRIKPTDSSRRVRSKESPHPHRCGGCIERRPCRFE